MLPPETPLCGSGAHSLPICAPISRARLSNPSSLKRGPSRLQCSARDSCGAGGLLLGEPLALAAQQRSEPEAIVERSERRKIRSPRSQIRGRYAERHVAHDLREPARQEDRVAMRGETRAERVAAAQPQGGDAADVGVELIERAEFAQQGGCDLRPYPGYAGNVVGSVAGEGEEVGEALGRDAEVALDVAVADLSTGAEVPQQVAVAHQLREILVARDEGRADAFRTHHAGERADDVVGLELPIDECPHTEMAAELPAVLELARQPGRRRLTVGLVGWVDPVAIRRRQPLVECDAD